MDKTDKSAGSQTKMDNLLSSDSEEERPLREKKQKKSRDAPETANGDSNELRINEKFATKFEQRERFKDLTRAKELLRDGDLDEDDSESDESEDEDAELLSSNLDLKILQTINSLKKKDPKIYDPNTKFFSDDEEGDDDESDDDDDEDGDNTKQHKKQTFKDIIRQQIQDNDNGDLNSDDDNEDSRAKLASKRSKSQLLYDHEQEKIRQQFLSAAGHDIADSEDEDLLLIKPKSAAEIADEERAIQAELEEMRRLETNEDDNDIEKVDFLQQYLSKKLWKEPKLKKRTHAIDDENSDDLEEDEEAVEEAERFESKYNFRFEEMAAEQQQTQSSSYDTASKLIMQQSAGQVMGHARTVEGSVRRTDDKRKQQREARKELKEKEKRQKENELRRLKNLKKDELKERLQKIGEISGLKKLGLIDEGFLDEEWDPEKHEQMMQGEFGEEYYNEDDDAMLIGEDDERYNVLPDDDEMLMDDDNNNYERQEIDEEAAKASISQLMGEYYALDYEDVIAGIPCRFKYTPVAAEDFGLTTEEILMADDNELNQFVSLKSIAPYRRKSSKDKSDKEIAKKRKRLQKALKAAAALSSADTSDTLTPAEGQQQEDAEPQQEQVTSTEVVEEGGHKRKRRKRKHREGEEANATAADDVEVEVTYEIKQAPASVTAVAGAAETTDGQVKSPHVQKQKLQGLPETRRQDRDKKEKKKDKNKKHKQEVRGKAKATKDKHNSKYNNKGGKDKKKQEASPEQRRMSLYK